MADTLTQREMKLFRSFTIPSRRDRYEALLSSQRGRVKVRQSLDHFGDLDLRYCKKLGAAEQSQSLVLALLQSHGAPHDCYVISSNAELDGRQLQLTEALDLIFGMGCGTFVCCIPGTLAYFEGESAGERYLCRREKQ